MQVLTLEGVKEAARKAYDEGRLMAQRPIQTDRHCIYVGDDGCGCAIGVGLDPETREAIVAEGDNGCSIASLEGEGHVKVDDILEPLRKIQRLHDNWCQAARDGDKLGSKLELFLEAIDHPSVSVSA